MKAILNRLEGLAAGSLRLVSLILVGLCATTATAAKPVVEWHSNFPSATTITKGVTIYPTNGASTSGGVITISSSDGQTGPAFSIPASGYVSVVFKADLTGVTLSAGQVLFAFGNNNKNYWTGARLQSSNSGLYASGIWGGTTDGGSWTNDDDSSNTIELTGEQTFLATYDKYDSSADKGTHLYVLQNGKATKVYGKSKANGLKSGDVTKISLGGGYGSLTGASRIKGLKITDCEIYVSPYSLPVRPEDLETSRRDFTGITESSWKIVQTAEEYGKGTVSISGATGVAKINVYAPDGTTSVGTITPDANGDGSLLSDGGVKVADKACWFDYEMNGNLNNTGVDTTALSYDNHNAGNSFFNSAVLYTYTHPYRTVYYPSTWTAVVRCTVPKVPNGAVITFGTQGGGLIGLLAGDNPETQMKLVKTTGNSSYTKLADMDIVNGTSAQHVYVFVVENDSTIKVYCDGSEVLNKTFAPFTLGGGFQVGSVHGGIGNTGIVRVWDGDDYTENYNLDADDIKEARIDCVRLYDYALTGDQITALSTEFPAVKLFQATISGGNDNVWSTLGWTGGDISTINAYSKAIITVTDDATLTLPSSITAEEFVINVASGKTLTLVQPAGGVSLTLGSPFEVRGGAIAFNEDLNFGSSIRIEGTGTVKLGNGVIVDEAISGAAQVEVPADATIAVMPGGSIANTIVGGGVISYQYFGSLPSALTFGNWTGTVVLPGFSADGINFNNYGISGSTVELTAVNGGWIAQDGTNIAPALKLAGNMTINAMSSWTYTFAEITGSGNLSFSTSANEPTVNITKVAEGYTGTISSTLANPVTITTLDRAAETPVTAGSKVLSTSSGVKASALTVAGVAMGIIPVFDTDGLYVKAASVTKNNSTVNYNTVSAAMTALGSDAGTLTLLMGTDSAITLAPGQTLVNGNLTTGGVAGPNGYELVNNNGTYTLVDNTASTWTGAGGDGSWNTGANWSTGYKPTQYTAVTFPANVDGWTVGIPGNAGNEKCASMTLNGDVTFQRGGNDWAKLCVYGAISGNGTLTLNQTCIKNDSGSVIKIPGPVAIVGSNDSAFLGANGWTIEGDLSVGGYLKAEAPITVTGDAVFAASGAKVETQSTITITGTTTLNGGFSRDVTYGDEQLTFGAVTVAASTTVSSGKPVTFSGMITLKDGSTLTVGSNVTISNDNFVVPNGWHLAKNDGTYSLVNNTASTWNGSADSDWENPANWSTGYVPTEYTAVTIPEDAIVTLPASPACASMTFEGAVTINLTGDLNYTGASIVANVIKFTGSGTFSCGAANTLHGTVNGDSTVTIAYPEGVLPTGATWTNEGWEGTLVLTNCGREKVAEHGVVHFNNYGNKYSKIKAPGYKGVSAALNQNTLCEAELIIDANTQFEFNHGNTQETEEFTQEGAGFRFAKLSGAGKLVLDGTTDTAQYIFNNVAGFTGDMLITFPDAGGRKSFIFGADPDWKIEGSAFPANLVIVSKVTAGDGENTRKWDVPAGVIITRAGELTLKDKTEITMLSTRSEGTLKVSAGTATVSGVMDGVVSANLDVASGATLKITDTRWETMTIPAYSTEGYLDLTACTELKTLHVTMGDATSFDLSKVRLPEDKSITIYYDIGEKRDLTGYAVLPSGVAAFYAEETVAEYAGTVFKVTNVPVGATVRLNRRNGTPVDASTPANEPTTRVYEGGKKFAGTACWHEWDFEKQDLSDSGKCTLQNPTVTAAPLATSASSFEYSTTSVGNETHYCIPVNIYPTATTETFTSPWGAAIRCTMPTTANTVAIAFGDTENGVLGLATGAQAGLVEMFNWTATGGYVTLARLSVESADTAMHIYAIGVNGNQATLYRDGEFIHTATFTLKEGGSITQFKVGDVMGANTETRETTLPAIANSGAVDYIRLYDKTLDADMAEGLAARRPFVSANKTYVREIASGLAKWSDTAAWRNAYDASDTVAQPEGGTHVTLSAPQGASMEVNVGTSETTYGTLIFKGGDKITLTKVDGTLKAGMVVVRTPVEVNWGAADFSTGMLGVDQGASLVFDLTDYPFEDVATTTKVKLTGVVVAREYDATVDQRISVIGAPTSDFFTITTEWENNCFYATVTRNYKTFTVDVPANTVVTVNGEAYTAGAELSLTYGTQVTISYAAAAGYIATYPSQTITVGSTTGSSIPATEGTATSAVAQIGDNYYPSLAAAVTAASAGDTITLIADDRVSLTTAKSSIEITKNITITGPVDENSEPLYTVYGCPTDNTVPNKIFIPSTDSAINVSIKNLKFDDFADGKATGSDHAVVYISTNANADNNVLLENLHVFGVNRVGFKLQKGNVIVRDCYIDSLNTVASGTILTKALEIRNANVTISNSTLLNSASNSERWSAAAVEVWDGATVAIDGCQISNSKDAIALYCTSSASTLTLSNNIASGSRAAIYAEGYATLIIESGDYSQGGYTFAYNASKVEINGGIFGKIYLNEAANNADLSVTGGTFNDIFYNYGTYATEKFVSGGRFIDSVRPKTYCVEGYVCVGPDADNYYTVVENASVAARNATTLIGYETLEAAFAAAGDGDTITLLGNCSGNGIIVPQDKFSEDGLTVDFAEYTYTVTGPELAGSSGTKTQAFQLLKGNKITFANGTITSSLEAGAKMLIQNYSNLTLDNMVLDGTNLDDVNPCYVLSTNNGSTEIKDTTINAAEGDIAFDACSGWGGYTSNSVAVDGNSSITGNIEVSFYGEGTAPSLALSSGTLDGNIVMAQRAGEATITKDPSFEVAAPADYEWDSTGKLVAKTYVAQVGEQKFETLEAAFAAAVAGDTITLLGNCTGNGIIVPQDKFGTTGLTVNLAGFTYTVTGPELAGSSGTKTQAFQLLKGNNITFANGTITSTLDAGAKMLIQNYSNLTLDNMVLDGTNLDDVNPCYVLSTNNGSTEIKDTTINAAEGDIAFDACSGWGGYLSNSVEVTGASVINGDVEVSYYGQTGTEPAALTLTSGTLNGEIIMEQGADQATVTKAATFVADAPADYEWDSTGKLVAKTYVAQVGEQKFESLEAAFATAEDGDTITLLGNCSGNGIKVPENKFATSGLTVDLGGFTYTVNGTTVGSTGTETQGFQLLKGNKITFKDGVITGSSLDTSSLMFLIQNYSDLSLDGVELSLVGRYYGQYTLSNNNGAIVINDSTINAPDYSWAGLSAAAVRSFAFDVCRYSSYPSVSVEVKGASVINGNIEVSASNNDAKDGFGLTFTSGTLNGTLVVDNSAAAAMEASPEVAKITVAGGKFADKDSVEDYVVNGYTLLQSGKLWVVEKEEEKAIDVFETEDAQAAIATITVDPTSETVQEFLAASEDGKTLEEALSTESENGLMGWQNYVLGQNPSEDLSVSAAPKSATEASLGKTFAPPEDTETGFTVTYSIETKKSGTDDVPTKVDNGAASIDLSTLGDGNNAQYDMKMTVVMTKDSVAVTQTVEKAVGVMKVASKAKFTIVAVPWKSLGSGDIKVNELLHTGNRSAGDKLYAYDKDNKDYASGTWELNADKIWEPVGVLKNSTMKYADENMTIRRGQGVWLERVNANQPIYLLGQVPETTEESVDVALEAGTADNPGWNLVASPAAEDLDVTNLSTEGAENDQIIVPTEGAPVNYTVKDNTWGYWKPTKDEYGIVRKVWTTDNIKVPAGQGFWYLNGGSAKELGL